MIIVLKPGANKKNVGELKKMLQRMGVEVKQIRGERWDSFHLIGDTSRIDCDTLSVHICIERIMRIQYPFKLASRVFHPEDTVVRIGDFAVGGGHRSFIAGPCSVESVEQVVLTAKLVKSMGATMFRGGAYKPRTSPYSFQGLEEAGLQILAEAREATGLPFVTEAMCGDSFAVVEKYADMIQIGARNMQNFSLLKRAGKSKKPILLKRGMSATLEEFLMSAEYIMAGGNHNVVLCERGIRTFDTYTRNTLDLSVVPAVKELSHLPIIVDPSHACGKWQLVAPLSKASIAVGADGLIIEVHHDPQKALCDGAQSLKPEKFGQLVGSLKRLMEVV